MDTYYQVSNKVELKVKFSSVAVMANRHIFQSVSVTHF